MSKLCKLYKSKKLWMPYEPHFSRFTVVIALERC